ncbi:hypothetical protein CC1G_09597 [Coprinopsis cinerea okayama7|uniref:Uncharacterized protein n=1 Tax=Coprinopsis cinerea (strain Okayama-7 / 130 / ATCC MYA-4618 / FGSC 9003) TaxID=240176 RepID=A8N4B3_COPC7|nr:hypothetical protein CC1G_09597 [Coprinopsis cinerea okayama7\|eukprot:XP_001829708.2 hypothetical protein CC1G_09597 [Coprinopsis cinerea okayama7\
MLSIRIDRQVVNVQPTREEFGYGLSRLKVKRAQRTRTTNFVECKSVIPKFSLCSSDQRMISARWALPTLLRETLSPPPFSSATVYA